MADSSMPLAGKWKTKKAEPPTHALLSWNADSFGDHRKKSLANRQTAGWQNDCRLNRPGESPHDETEKMCSSNSPPESFLLHWHQS
jgi:hypothetical protein